MKQDNREIKSKCEHPFLMTSKNEAYCPDCGLCMKTYIKNGKKFGKSWIEKQDNYIPTTHIFYETFRNL